MEQVQEIAQVARDIELQPVKSSNITAIGYSEQHQVLLVQFSSGSKYAYGSVTAEEWQELREAQSLGSHFAKAIRPRGGQQIVPWKE